MSGGSTSVTAAQLQQAYAALGVMGPAGYAENLQEMVSMLCTELEPYRGYIL